MSRPMLGDGMYVAMIEIRPKFVAFLEVERELNLAEKWALQQT